jgi:hypothetical protein
MVTTPPPKEYEMASIRDTAEWMVEHHKVSVIPLGKESKRPQEPDWPNMGRATAEEVRTGLEAEENYGVLCEGMTIIDFDPRNMDVLDSDDESQVEYLIMLIRKAHKLGPTLEVTTGGGGMHLYYHGESNMRKLEQGVDIKSGRAHQVVGPGSIHPNTRRKYFVSSLKGATIQPLPSTVRPVATHEPGDYVGTGESADIPEGGIEEGDRNLGLYRYLCKMRAFGVDDDTLDLLAVITNKTKIHPPMGEQEVQTIANSAKKFEAGTMALDQLTQGVLTNMASERKQRAEIPEGWITPDQLEAMEEPEYLIEKVLPRYGVGHLVGESYAGKTFVALDMAMRLATGAEEWMGHKLLGTPERVAYVAMEGGFDLGQRVRAWREMHGGEPSDDILFLVEQPFDLMGPEAADALDKLDDFQPSVIFIDTQSLAAPRVDENDNSGMTSLMSNVKLMASAYGCLVMLVHHAGFGDKGRERGASSQFANMDVSLFVKKGQSQNAVGSIKMRKLKSGPLSDDMHFVLEDSGKSVAVMQVDPIEEMQDTEDTFEFSPGVLRILDILKSPDLAEDGATLDLIAKWADRSETVTRRHLKTLEEAHHVRLVERERTGVKGDRHRYIFVPSDPDSEDQGGE